MNPIVFSEILTDLPDEFIESAADLPVRRTYRRFSVPAVATIAAGIVLMISVLIYPNMKTQMPEVTENIHVTTEAVQTTVVQSTVTSATNTAKESIVESKTHKSESKKTDMQEKITTTLTETKTSTENESVTIQTNTETPDETDLPLKSAEMDTTIFTETTVYPIIKKIVPLWKGATEYPSSVPHPHFAYIFNYYPVDGDPTPEETCEMYGIPVEYMQSQCILVTISTDYSDAVIVSGEWDATGLVLNAVCSSKHEKTTEFHYAFPIPNGLVIDLENCRIEYKIAEDEKSFREILNDSPEIEIEEPTSDGMQ